MIEARIVKAIMVGCLAVVALLVAFDNLTDYATNYAFVRHVLSMDATLPGNALLMWQSPEWNGQQPAFRFYMTILAVLIFVNQPDGELG